MTDTEQKRIEEICKTAHIEDIGELSDGYHTFNQLYYQRMMLFAALVKQNRYKAWKSLRHSDGELCFGGGWFIVGIDTPEGSYTYHYKAEYFDLFDCEELERGKVWDGHTEKDVTRLLSLEQQPCENAVSREKVGQWVSVKDRLPKEREWYLAVFREADTGFQLIPRVADYIGEGENKWRLIDKDGLASEYRDLLECVAWMPLPQTFKAESEEVSDDNN